MEIKKIKIEDVHQTIPDKDYKSVYNALKVRYGQRMIFADYRVGSGFYSWSAPGDGWKLAYHVGADVYNRALKMVDDFAASEPESLRRLFQTPKMEEYLFCRDNNGEFQVMLAGWGFRYPVVVAPPPAPPVKVGVWVSFSDLGNKLPDHSFILRGITAEGDRTKRTDDTGECYLGETLEGTTITVFDLLTNREFAFTVVKDKNHYDFDLGLTKPEEPKEEEEVKVEEKPPVVVIPEPPVEMLHFTVLDCEDIPVNGKLTLIQGNEQKVSVDLDASGKVDVPENKLKRGIPTEAVIVRKDQPDVKVQFTIDNGENDYLLQEEKKPVPNSGVLILLFIMLLSLILFSALWWEHHGPSLLENCSDSLYIHFHIR